MLKKTYNFEKGEVLLIDKPLNWTSFDVVKNIRNALRIKKIGHAGTLDPLATGLLILCTGKKTKEVNIFQEMEKEYEGKMVIGKTTPSVDLETAIDQEYDISHIREEEIYEVVNDFIGFIDQVPPVYSAIKVNGERVYKKARKGQSVELSPRKVNVLHFEITEVKLPELCFKVRCSKGTYIRSLVRDYGEKLGVGAYMSQLRRTAIGEFQVKQAVSPADFLNALI
ncbi:MAG: tRNA pseudouridine(55) synthase TruB [Bacteroidetes bacterium]|nr:tRNA pseudouridine(55) synthase TruB [Bacteroidota bacterium]